MTDTLNLSLWVARRAEQGTLQAHADYVVREIKLLEQAVKYEADLVQQALGSRKELEAQVVELEAEVEGCMAVIATERAEVLALRRKLAKVVGFIKNFALRAMIEEHDEDERDMIDFDSLRFERDCDIVQARTTLAELKGETDAE